jgi:hypothetical protein
MNNTKEWLYFQSWFLEDIKQQNATHRLRPAKKPSLSKCPGLNFSRFLVL